MQLGKSDIRFTPGLWPTVAAVVVIALTVHLARWQQGRAAEKTLLQAEFERRAELPPLEVNASLRDADAMRYRRLIAHGKWLAPKQIFIDNKIDGETAGYHVVTPLQVAGTAVLLLVNRGWVPRGATYPRPPKVEVPAGPVEVEGIAVVPSTRFLELSSATVEGAVWQNLTVARYREASGQDVLPVMLLAKAAPTGLKPVVEKPDARVDKHIEYMLTWYSLAATTLLLWIGLNLKIRKRPDAAAEATEKS